MTGVTPDFEAAAAAHAAAEGHDASSCEVCRYITASATARQVPNPLGIKAKVVRPKAKRS